MTEIPKDAVKCLDKGFVRLVDSMGGDDAIVQAARVSYGKGTSKVSQDRGLIRYLMRPATPRHLKWWNSSSTVRRPFLSPDNGSGTAPPILMNIHCATPKSGMSFIIPSPNIFNSKVPLTNRVVWVMFPSDSRIRC